MNSRERLMLHGFTVAEIDALELLWKNPRTSFLLSTDARVCEEAEWTVGDTFDALFHDLEVWDALRYVAIGYTPHQLATIRADQRAWNNLTNGRSPLEQTTFLIAKGVPRQFVVDVLRLSNTPVDADAEMRRWHAAAAGLPQEPGQTTETLEQAIGVLAAMLPPPRLNCPPGCE